MRQIKKGFTCLAQEANFIIVFNDREYFTKTKGEAEELFNSFLEIKEDHDFLKMFKRVPIEGEMHYNN